MAARSKARKRALDVLFEADQRGLDPLRAARRAAGRGPTRRSPEYAVDLVEGVAAHRERIDELLADLRPGLDARPDAGGRPQRAAAGGLRAALHRRRPDAVAINEAVELARQLSTDDSPGFVNGLLARLLELKPTLAAADARPQSARRARRQVRAGASPAPCPIDPSRCDRRRARAGRGRQSSGCSDCRARASAFEHAPVDQLLGQHRRRHVVDDRQGAQVVGRIESTLPL